MKAKVKRKLFGNKQMLFSNFAKIKNKKIIM